MAQQRSSNAETKEDLAKQIEQLRADVSEITKTLRELSKGEATELRSRAEQRAAELRSQGSQVADDIAAEVSDLERKVGENMQQRPLQTLAIAAGLGLLIGLLTRR